MTTAHKLARKLLAGADYEVIIEVQHGTGARVGTVQSNLCVMKYNEQITQAAIVITPEPAAYDVQTYDRCRQP